ncbi:MAG: hypothetical protein R6U63_02410 [Longimicrobiales bacterium]
MITKRMMLASLVLLWAAQPAPAQETAADSQAVAVAEILQAIQLPDVSEVLRERGVPMEEIEEMIDAARARGVTAGESTDVLEETAEAVEDTGPIENFGAFVQEQLQAGLRGRELAEAIRAEHRSRGIGQGNKLESRRGQGQGPPGQRGRGERGPDSAEGPGSRGGPDSAAQGRGNRGGPPGERGRPPERDTTPDRDTIPGGGEG